MRASSSSCGRRRDSAAPECSSLRGSLWAASSIAAGAPRATQRDGGGSGVLPLDLGRWVHADATRERDRSGLGVQKADVGIRHVRIRHGRDARGPELPLVVRLHARHDRRSVGTLENADAMSRCSWCCRSSVTAARFRTEAVSLHGAPVRLSAARPAVGDGGRSQLPLLTRMPRVCSFLAPVAPGNPRWRADLCRGNAIYRRSGCSTCGRVIEQVYARAAAGDGVYVYYGGGQAFRYYANHSGLSMNGVLEGKCHGRDPREYLRELDQFRGRSASG